MFHTSTKCPFSVQDVGRMLIAHVHKILYNVQLKNMDTCIAAAHKRSGACSTRTHRQKISSPWTEHATHPKIQKFKLIVVYNQTLMNYDM